MNETFILPAKKSLDIPGKVLAIVLLLALSVLQSTTATAVEALIIDRFDAKTSATGEWKRLNVGNQYGNESLHTPIIGATYTYNVTLPTPGEYQVFAWWNEYAYSRTSVPYDITHMGGTSTVTVNQQKNSGQWNQLGTSRHFDKIATITIRSLGNGYTTADAIMLVPVGVNTNTTPKISGFPATRVDADSFYYFTPSASNPNGDSFSITNKPA
jgi:hypothetical protein